MATSSHLDEPPTMSPPSIDPTSVDPSSINQRSVDPVSIPSASIDSPSLGSSTSTSSQDELSAKNGDDHKFYVQIQACDTQETVNKVPGAQAIKRSHDDISSDSEQFDIVKYVDVLRNKIRQLCKAIGLGDPQDIEVMEDGQKSTVVGFAIQKERHRYTLRIPCLEGKDSTSNAQEIKNQVAVLLHLAPLLPVASIVAYDSSPNNVIGRPYLIQERLSGQNANEVYDKLSIEERIQVVKAVADVVLKMKDIEFPGAGRLAASGNMAEKALNPTSVPIAIAPFHCGGLSTNEVLPEQRQPVSVLSLITTALDLRADHHGKETNSFYLKMFSDVRKIAEKMDFNGFFDAKDQKCMLCYSEFDRGNVLLDKQDGKWVVSGISGWDKAMSLPQTLAATPPSWLWVNFEDHQNHGWRGMKLDDVPNQFGEDDLMMKLYYDEIIEDKNGFSCPEETYGRGKWIRHIVHFALWPFSSRTKEDYIDFLDKWTTYSKLQNLAECGNADDGDRARTARTRDQKNQEQSHDQDQMTWGGYYEPFTAYRFRVLELCKVLGLGEPDEIEVVGYGSSHQVAGINFSSGTRWVLRTPIRLRYSEPIKRENGKYKIATGNDAQDTKDQVAAILFAAQHLPVPTIIAYDSSENNPLRNRYVIQQRIAGQPARTIYSDKLSISERLQIAECMAEITKKFRTVEFPLPGRLVADKAMPDSAFNPSGQYIKVESFVEDEEFLQRHPEPTGLEPFLCYLMKYRASKRPKFSFDALQNQVVKYSPKSTDPDFIHDIVRNSHFKNLHKVLKQMGDAGYFTNASRGKCVLWHWDLSSENVLIQKSDDGNWKVSGIIDFDDCVSVPKIIASTPPSWLWINEALHGYYVWQGYKLDYNPWGVQGEDLAVKLYYDHLAKDSPHYDDDTYGKGKWIRRLAEFALTDRFHSNEDYEDYELILKEWDDLCRKNSWGAFSQSRPDDFETDWSDVYASPPFQWSDESCSETSEDEDSEDENDVENTESADQSRRDSFKDGDGGGQHVKDQVAQEVSREAARNGVEETASEDSHTAQH